MTTLVCIAVYALTIGLVVAVGKLVAESRKVVLVSEEDYARVLKNNQALTMVKQCMTFLAEYSERLEPWAWHKEALFMRACLSKELEDDLELIDPSNYRVGVMALAALDIFIVTLETKVDLGSMWALKHDMDVLLNKCQPWGESL